MSGTLLLDSISELCEEWRGGVVTTSWKEEEDDAVTGHVGSIV